MYTFDDKSKKKSILDYLKEKEFKGTGIDFKYYSNGIWRGHGAEILGFANTPILDGELERLAQGLHPKTGEKIAKKSPLPLDERYLSSCLSSVKDFSMLAYLDTDMPPYLFDFAYNRALVRTYNYMEKFCEAKLNNKNDKEKAGLIIADIPHETARPTKDGKSSIRPDMQKHDHTMISTIAVLEDGRCFSLVNKKLFVNQKAIGAFFRKELARELRDMGYNIVPRTDAVEAKEGKIYINSFGVEGVSDEHRAFFSKRNNEIEYLSKKYGTTSVLGKKKLASTFKATKQVYERSELIKIWREDANDIGFTPEYIRENVRTSNPYKVVDFFKTDEELIGSIAEHGKMNESVIMARLFEYEAITGVDAHETFDRWKNEKKILPIGQFKFKSNIDLAQKPMKMKTLKNKISSNKKSVVLGIVKSKHYTLDDLVQDKVGKNHLPMLSSFGTVEVKNITFDSPKYAKSEGIDSNFASSFFSNIEGLGVVIATLEMKLRDPKLTPEKAASIKARIESLQAEVEALKLKELNKPKYD